MGAMHFRDFSKRWAAPIWQAQDANKINKTNKDGKKTMNIVRSFSEWRRYRATCNELNRLSARELNDLGINRGDIPFVARKVTRA